MNHLAVPLHGLAGDGSDAIEVVRAVVDGHPAEERLQVLDAARTV
ncbi:hypothetical protein ACIBCU_17625 [Streptomyces sp. NPDC051064]